MTNRLGEKLLFAATWVAVLLVSVSPVIAQTSAEVPRTWAAHPDLNGVWQAIGTAHWDIQDHPASAGHPDMGAIGAIPPGQGVVVGNEVPYQAWAIAQKQTNFENRLTEDPEIKCYLPGVPRATYLPYPFQIIQGDRKVMIVYGFAEANRTIHMDKDNPEPGVDGHHVSVAGDGVGRQKNSRLLRSYHHLHDDAHRVTSVCGMPCWSRR